MTFENSKKITIEELAKRIGEELTHDYKEYDYESLEDMMRNQDLTWKEMKDEVYYMVKHYANEEDYLVWMNDDYSIETQDEYLRVVDTMGWREFKKLILANVQ